jgi:hypothetical protein
MSEQTAARINVEIDAGLRAKARALIAATSREGQLRRRLAMLNRQGWVYVLGTDDEEAFVRHAISATFAKLNRARRDKRAALRAFFGG